MTLATDQWESDELANLMNICSSYKNLGAGQTEKVLSNIFMIASKFCIFSTEESSKDFITIYAENSLQECIRM